MPGRSGMKASNNAYARFLLSKDCRTLIRAVISSRSESNTVKKDLTCCKIYANLFADCIADLVACLPFVCCLLHLHVEVEAPHLHVVMPSSTNG